MHNWNFKKSPSCKRKIVHAHYTFQLSLADPDDKGSQQAVERVKAPAFQSTVLGLVHWSTLGGPVLPWEQINLSVPFNATLLSSLVSQSCFLT
jgi:hypothetical protein